MTHTRWHTSFSQIDSSSWNALLPPEANPCLRHEFFTALENSHSASARSGWEPHIWAKYEDETLVAAAPLWLRADLGGEYLWDYGFVNAAREIGRPWFPRLVGQVPCTPTAAYRLLCAEDVVATETLAFCEAARTRAKELKAAHIVFNFVDPAWSQHLPQEFRTMAGQSWVWERNGATTFDDYLASFGKNQRRNVKREIASVAEQGFEVKVVRGEDAPNQWFERMARLYHQTNDQYGPWAARWVTTEWFEELSRPGFRELCAFSVALAPGNPEPVAMAFILFGGSWLVGRYWGADVNARDLHFVVCYYEPIRFAIENKLDYFDPGAGSEHKVRRGFVAYEHPVRYCFLDPVWDRIFVDNIGRFNAGTRQGIAALNAESPLKKSTTADPDSDS